MRMDIPLTKAGNPQRSSMTLKEVGTRLGFSKELIGQIQNKSLSKLRIVAEDRMVMSTTGS